MVSSVIDSPDMAPKSIRLDVRCTPLQVERCDKLAELMTTDRPDIARQALDLGLEALEERIVRQYQFSNSLLVNEKLKRRGADIRTAIAQLEAGGDIEAAILLLKSAIG